MAFLAVFALVILVIGGALWLIARQQEANQITVTADNKVNVGSGYRNITYKGRKYQYNNRITTILYAGLDSEAPLVQNAKYTMAPRADSISLIVLDDLHKKATVIALSRDTMTEIRRYSLSGKKNGLYVDHLGYAYTYGDGGKASCDGLCEAVSLLLYGIPVNDYVVSNVKSMQAISSFIGPVEVTVPNNDLAEKNELYTEGAIVSIDSSNVEMFVRSRDTARYFSNEGRMLRQKAYITGAMARMKNLLNDKPEEFWRILQETGDYVQTNITRNRYLDLIKLLHNIDIANPDYIIPEGEQVAGKYHDEFHPDEAKLLDIVVELFYNAQ